ncbi:diguanylate cyclase [Sulfuritalea sp.]|uniref:sensor domain-containing diguanylate cyclase n=1 Tax=Sulfuritalea sp. TaxID=2480090 RepID=UPI00286E07B2|nr:diguanylate cyclase [Sulfuritalea sp.]
MNYRNRSASWVILFLVVAVHLYQQAGPSWVWAALVLQFLVYPHLVYWRARLARDPLQSEIGNMLLDSFCFGIWSAGMGFPLWIAFIFFVSVSINLAAFEGGKGVAKVTAAHALGMAVALPFAGLRFLPDSSLAVAFLSMFCLLTYLVMYGISTHRRTLKLHQVREKLRENEIALQSQLFEIRLLQSQLKEQVDRDHLTGLYNRRYLAATIDRELARCLRDGSPLSAMMADIDHFKQINDTHGHQFGDKVLVAVAATLSDSLRAGDIACRYGGEEFLLLLPNMPLDTAKARAEEIRHTVGALSLEVDGRPFSVQISVGLAEAPRDANDADTLVRRADAALYRAKAAGRNRVEISA